MSFLERELVEAGYSAILRSGDADKARSESLVVQIREVVVTIIEISQAISIDLEINRGDYRVECCVDEGL